ncbi:MAG: hypothetical protein WBW33_15455, partial [Bryobacteraceae bacterium]
ELGLQWRAKGATDITSYRSNSAAVRWELVLVRDHRRTIAVSNNQAEVVGSVCRVRRQGTMRDARK